MLITFVMALWLGTNSDVAVLKTYQNPPEDSDAFLASPADVDFASDGRMYLADKTQNKIFVWASDGTFLKAFSQKGQGPGEVNNPTSIAVLGNEVWVNQQTRLVSIFDLDGTFKRSFSLQWQTKSLIPLGQGQALCGVLSPVGETGDMTMDFYIYSEADKRARLLKQFKNETKQSALGSQGEITLAAYAGDLDMQHDEHGTVFFGYSLTKNLYSLTENGEIAKEYRYDFLDMKATKQEEEAFMSQTFPMGDGTRLEISKIPSMKFSFENNKAYYTQFVMKGDKVMFILTPIGSTGIGLAFSWGQYAIFDKEKGTLLSRGSYHYPEDSLVFSRSGRLLAALVGEGGEYQIQELSFKGF